MSYLKRPWLSCAILTSAIGCVIIATVARTEPQLLDSSAVIIAGIQINQTNLPDWDVYPNGDEYWISVADLDKHLAVRSLDSNANSLQLESPLGSASVPLKETAIHPTTGRHISSGMLAKQFRIQSSFNSADYVLDFSVPWHPSESTKLAAAEDVAPDVFAPSGSLSFIRIQNDANYNFHANDRRSNSKLTLGGSAAKGSWLASLSHDNQQSGVIHDLFWNTSFPNSTHRIGTNHINLSPLLEGYQFTGVQSAWTNKNIQLFTDFDLNHGFNSFLTEDVAQQETITRTDGPPAGIAELKIDGNRIALVRVNLDGFYEFRNVRHRQGDYQQVEIHLYEQSLAQQPIRVINLSRNSTAQMLDKNQHLLRSGFGFEGNAFDDNTDPEQLGFLQYRYGVSNRLTLQFAAQSKPNNAKSFLAGFRASLGKNWAFGFDAARQHSPQAGSRNAIRLDLSGSHQKWRSEFNTVYSQAGFLNNDNSDEPIYDVRYSGIWDKYDRLKIGVYARGFRTKPEADFQYSGRYILPGVFGRFNNQWSFYIKPDPDGKYRAGSEYFDGRKQRLTFSHHKSEGTSLVHSFYPSQWQTWLLGIENRSSLFEDIRLFAQADIFPFKHYRSFIQVGLSHSTELTDGFLTWNSIVKSGIEVQLQYEKSSSLKDNAADSENFWLRTKLNFAKTGRKLVMADNSAINFNRGGITGSVVDVNGKQIDLNEIQLNIDGRKLPQTSLHGHYYISDMKPGVYTVSMDEQNLPIEYEAVAPVKVEVRASAITNVDLAVQARFGFSGQIIDHSGQAIQNASLNIHDQNGAVVGKATTDSFGYYRVDGLLSGTYRVKVDNNPHEGILVKLSDDYLFDQNIKLAN